MINFKKMQLTEDIHSKIDDFGTGNNTDISVVDTYDPIMIKLADAHRALCNLYTKRSCA